MILYYASRLTIKLMVDQLSEHIDHFITFIQLFKICYLCYPFWAQLHVFCQLLFQSIWDICLLCTEKEVKVLLNCSTVMIYLCLRRLRPRAKFVNVPTLQRSPTFVRNKCWCYTRHRLQCRPCPVQYTVWKVFLCHFVYTEKYQIGHYHSNL